LLLVLLNDSGFFAKRELLPDSDIQPGVLVVRVGPSERLQPPNVFRASKNGSRIELHNSVQRADGVRGPISDQVVKILDKPLNEGPARLAIVGVTLAPMKAGAAVQVNVGMQNIGGARAFVRNPNFDIAFCKGGDSCEQIMEAFDKQEAPDSIAGRVFPPEKCGLEIQSAQPATKELISEIDTGRTIPVMLLKLITSDDKQKWRRIRCAYIYDYEPKKFREIKPFHLDEEIADPTTTPK
jgi:hypothetical protein